MPTDLLLYFERVTRTRTCPICGRPDWCLVGRPNTEFEGCALCQRVESPYRFGDAGCLHRPDGIRPKRRLGRRITIALRRSGNELLARFAADAEASLSSASLQSLASRLDLTSSSLGRLGVGEVSPRLAKEHDIAWAGCAWTFPMCDSEGAVTGIRLRLRDGSRYAVPGGREGLFLPRQPEPTEQLLVCEGPTDTAAMLDLGFAAIGRPNCSGGRRDVIEYVRRTKPRSVVVVADPDAPGQRGARELARALVTRVPQVRVIDPPAGIKDARAWKSAGGTMADVQGAIGATIPWSLSVRLRAGRV